MITLTHSIKINEPAKKIFDFFMSFEVFKKHMMEEGGNLKRILEGAEN